MSLIQINYAVVASNNAREKWRTRNPTPEHHGRPHARPLSGRVAPWSIPIAAQNRITRSCALSFVVRDGLRGRRFWLAMVYLLAAYVCFSLI